jgi:hypothetical protein
MASWTNQAKYERGDDSFYILVKDKIVIEELWKAK